MFWIIYFQGLWFKRITFWTRNCWKRWEWEEILMTLSKQRNYPQCRNTFTRLVPFHILLQFCKLYSHYQTKLWLTFILYFLLAWTLVLCVFSMKFWITSSFKVNMLMSVATVTGWAVQDYGLRIITHTGLQQH